MKLPTAKAQALTIGSVLLLVACSGTAVTGYQPSQPEPVASFTPFPSPWPVASPLRLTEAPEPVPSPSPRPSPSPSPKPSPRPSAAVTKPAVTTRSVDGQATWYCGAGSRCTRGYPAGNITVGGEIVGFAAAGSELQVGDWRGRVVTVTCAGCPAIKVKLIDVCACKGRRIIDLYHAAFNRLADPSRGVLEVRVSW